MTWPMSSSQPPEDLHTLPYGVFQHADRDPAVGVRIGDSVLDLAAAAAAAEHPHAPVFDQASLNALMALGPAVWGEVRSWVVALVGDLTNQEGVTAPPLIDLAEVQMLLPIDVADYVDFYASESHATNVGKLFRPDSPALPPNWKHLPIGYHGRAGTVVVSGTDVVRPQGQRHPGPDGTPPFGPSTRLDIECEVGFIVGRGSQLGRPVPVEAAREHVFGVVLLNDWSARDIQAWEYVPLGPFLGKSFATSISAWVVPLEALSSAEVVLPDQDPEPLPYLRGDDSALFGLDLHLQVEVNGSVVAVPEFRDMYWSAAQMLAHLTVNGASLRVGDLFASGTVSGHDPTTFGSLLELTWNGSQPIRLADGSTRGFLEDGDTVTLRGWASGSNGRSITLGEVSGRIVPSG
jgi:fumarylacetoacetase